MSTTGYALLLSTFHELPHMYATMHVGLLQMVLYVSCKYCVLFIIGAVARRLLYLSHQRAAKAQVNLRICTDSPAYSLLHTRSMDVDERLRHKLDV